MTGGLAAQPASHDFGGIRKGTRAVRQFDFSNTSDQPITTTMNVTATVR